MAQPAQKAKPHIKVNLLHPQGEVLDIGGKAFKWLTGYGRYFIIVVEIIVLALFFVRFQMKATDDNYAKQINEEVNKIKARSEDEKLIKQVQTKITQVKQNLDARPSWMDIVTKIAQKTPQTVTVTNINLDHTQASKNLNFKITSQTKINSDIGLFLNSLRDVNADEANKTFANINLAGLSYDKGLLTFTITGSTK